MRSSKRQLLFDTSGVNELAKDTTGAITRAAAIAYSVKITGTNAAELGATRNSSQRKQLLSTLRLLLADGVCLVPSRWVIRRHANDFLKDQSQYEWQQLDVRCRGTERTIAIDTLIDDENSSVLLAENVQLEEQFNNSHKGERMRLDEVMGKRAFSSFTEYLSVLLEDGVQRGVWA